MGTARRYWRRHGQAVGKHRLVDREHRGGRADAEPENRDGREGKGRGAANGADGHRDVAANPAQMFDGHGLVAASAWESPNVDRSMESSGG